MPFSRKDMTLDDVLNAVKFGQRPLGMIFETSNKGSDLSHWKAPDGAQGRPQDPQPVRKTPSRPRYWANFSLFEPYPHQESAGRLAASGPT